MLTGLIELSHKMKGETKWNKEKYIGNQQFTKKTGTQINDLEQKEEINIQPEKNEETRIQKKWREA